MKQIHAIDSLPALRAISDPLRMSIIRELRGKAMTTAQVASALAESATKLHYHIGELERNGIVEVVETRQKGNLVEKYYRAVAEFFRVEPSLFHGGPQALEAFYLSVQSILDTSAVQLRRAIDAGEVTDAEASLSLRSILHLTLAPSEAEEFRTRLRALVEEYREKSTPTAGRGVSLTLLWYPSNRPPSADETEERTAE